MNEQLESSVDTQAGLSARSGGWRFGGSVSRNFDTHAARSIPSYREGQELIARLSDSFLSRGSLCYDLGCGTGQLSQLLGERHAHRNVSVQAIELEEDMAALAQERCSGLPNVTVSHGDVTRLNFEPANMMVAHYTMQFIERDARLPLLESAARALRPGGALVMFEKVRASHPRIQDIVTQLYNDFKLANGFTADEIIAKARSLRGVLEPLSSEENDALLEAAGFPIRAPVFRYLCFEGTLAIK